jgi:molecular chaperone GrpE
MEQNEEHEELLPDAASSDTEIEIQKLVEERDLLQDRLLRKHAEFDNYRKRVERERSEYAQQASAELMRELLNVLDSFDLAMRNAASESSEGKDLLKGLDLVYKQLLDTLGRFGLKPIEAKGEVFDPNFHQAISTVPSTDVAENTVVEQFRRGYTLNGRLLRPSMVSVSAGGGEGTRD